MIRPRSGSRIERRLWMTISRFRRSSMAFPHPLRRQPTVGLTSLTGNSSACHSKSSKTKEGLILRWCVLLTDFAERKCAEALLDGEKPLLEMVTSGCPLEDVLLQATTQ